MDKLNASLIRFSKAFVAGGIGAIFLLLASGVKITSIDDAKHMGLVALGAFITGGLMGLEKAYNWQAPQEISGS